MVERFEEAGKGRADRGAHLHGRRIARLEQSLMQRGIAGLLQVHQPFNWRQSIRRVLSLAESRGRSAHCQSGGEP